MASFFENLDAYAIRARLFPALIVVAPIGMAVLAWFPDGVKGWGLISGLLVTCGGTTLLAQLGRDLGKRKEPQLFESWGGTPTTVMLRHRTGRISKTTLTRYHQKLKSLLPSVTVPSAEEEARDPAAADDAYRSCVDYLREKTRDSKLVFQENVYYGFRRNLWGMKAAGVFAAVLGVLGGAGSVWQSLAGSAILLITGVVVTALNILLLVIWLLRVTPGWVRIAADAYAERLLASCDKL